MNESRARKYQVVIGRQPIFDSDLLVVGYQLMSDPRILVSPAGTIEQDVADESGTDALADSIGVGLNRIVGDKWVVYRAGRAALYGGIPLVIPPGKLIVAATAADIVSEDGMVYRALTDVAEHGHHLAITDFSGDDRSMAALEHMEMAAIDVQRHGIDQTARLAAEVKKRGRNVCAYRIRTTEEKITLARDANVDYLMGLAWSRPKVGGSVVVSPIPESLIRISSMTLDENTDIDDVEKIIRRDASLTVQLLEIASIGRIGHPRRNVRSIREAIVLLGNRRLRVWVTLLTLRKAPGSTPGEMIEALTRARMCELLHDGDIDGSAFAFASGMVSALDRMTGVPAEKLVESLPIGESVVNAAFRSEGNVGEMIDAIRWYESGSEDYSTRFYEVAAESLRWAASSMQAVESAAARKVPTYEHRR